MTSNASDVACGATRLSFRRMILVIVCFVLFLSLIQASAQSPPDDVKVTQHSYLGKIKPASGQSVPILIRIFKFNSEKEWSGAFILGDEAGPYAFDKVTYDPAKNELYVAYNAGTKQLAWWSKLKTKPDNTLSGELAAPSGALGVLDLTPDESFAWAANLLYA